MKSATTNFRTRLQTHEPGAIFCPPAETSLPILSGRNNMVSSSCLAFCPLGTTSRNLNKVFPQEGMDEDIAAAKPTEKQVLIHLIKEVNQSQREQISAPE